MKYFSMFSGIGGFELGLQRSQHPFQCVGYSEIEPNAISIYTRHFPQHRNYGDATRINTAEIPDFDLLVGGFPCQAFSIAGRKKGFNDCRGTLFFEIARVLRDKQPRYFLLENVKNLLSHDRGKTFQTILQTLGELGYYVRWEIHNSKDYQTPQNRERVFIEGYHRERESIGKILHKPATGAYNKQKIRNLFGTGKLSQQQRLMSIDGISPTVPANYDALGFFDDGYGYRLLTPVERERLQTFPDNWTEYGADGKRISDTQRCIVVGNAVTVNVVTAIINKMFN